MIRTLFVGMALIGFVGVGACAAAEGAYGVGVASVCLAVANAILLLQ